jgi:hypothetical protein
MNLNDQVDKELSCNKTKTTWIAIKKESNTIIRIVYFDGSGEISGIDLG